MIVQSYEKGLLAWFCYRAAQSDSITEMLAIGCTVRNRVLRHNSTYSDVIQDLADQTPLRAFPSVTDPVLITPGEGLLDQVDKIYDYSLVDVTSSHLQREGALFFARPTQLDPESLFYKTIIERPDLHPLLGTWGSQSFYK